MIDYMDYHGLSWTIKTIKTIIYHHRLSWTIMDYHGLLWTIMDYHGQSQTSWTNLDYPSLLIITTWARTNS